MINLQYIGEILRSIMQAQRLSKLHSWYIVVHVLQENLGANL